MTASKTITATSQKMHFAPKCLARGPRPGFHDKGPWGVPPFCEKAVLRRCGGGGIRCSEVMGVGARHGVALVSGSESGEKK